MSETLVVIGLGYVGLPLAQAACGTDLKVIGLDLNKNIVSDLNQGTSHIDDLSNEDIGMMKDKGFIATSDPECLSTADVVVICVPTPLSDSGGPDLGAVIAATRSVSKHIHPGMMVVLESTTYPGTTEDVVKPILEESGLKDGKDFDLVFSPERIDPGNPNYGMKNTPKVVGADTLSASKRGVAFYEKFVDQVFATKGTREAEMAKLLENTYRHVNIALMNELVEFCNKLKIDLWDAIAAASSKPFGYQAFYPGPGVGGHCIPIDPNYLSHHVKTVLGRPFRFVELAQEINAGMPSYVRRRAQDILNEQGLALKGAKILLLGVTYKPNIADQRESPVRPLARELLDLGAIVSFADPYVESWNVDSEHEDHPSDRIIEATRTVIESCAHSDLVIILQPHKEFDMTQIALRANAILDTRGVLEGANVQSI